MLYSLKGTGLIYGYSPVLGPCRCQGWGVAALMAIPSQVWGGGVTGDLSSGRTGPGVHWWQNGHAYVPYYRPKRQLSSQQQWLALFVSPINCRPGDRPAWKSPTGVQPIDMIDCAGKHRRVSSALFWKPNVHLTSPFIHRLTMDSSAAR